MLEQYLAIQFEGHELMCVANWDDYLHRKYGDYMKLLPLDEQVWKHHPIIIIDFEHNYEELR